MLNTIKENVLKPLLTRCGSFIAGWLIAIGANVEHAHLVAGGVIGAGLILCDLAFAYARKKGIERKALAKAGVVTAP